jgi:cation-transporting ATPase E
MEPNYERVGGRFLPSVLRRAFPGGLTNIFVVVMAQAFMALFDLSLDQIAAVCAAIIGVVGLLVLYQTCKPFDKFRRFIWFAMAACLLGCFTLLADFFELQRGDAKSSLIAAVLLIMTPTVFFAIQRVFDWGDRVAARIRQIFHRKKRRETL